MKHILIIFDSKFGNTEQLAKEIGIGIKATGIAECDIINIRSVESHDLAKYDGVLFGAPIHVFRATSGIKSAVKRAAKKGLDGKMVAAFDTYQIPGHRGKAAHQIRDLLSKKTSGAKFFSHDLTSLVDGYEGPLNAAEPPKAQEFGQQFVQALGE